MCVCNGSKSIGLLNLECRNFEKKIRAKLHNYFTLNWVGGEKSHHLYSTAMRMVRKLWKWVAQVILTRTSLTTIASVWKTLQSVSSLSPSRPHSCTVCVHCTRNDITHTISIHSQPKKNKFKRNTLCKCVLRTYAIVSCALNPLDWINLRWACFGFQQVLHLRTPRIVYIRSKISL